MHRLWPWHRQVDAEVAARRLTPTPTAAAAARHRRAAPVIQTAGGTPQDQSAKIAAKDIEIGASYA
jgi:hypothetical protein